MATLANVRGTYPDGVMGDQVVFNPSYPLFTDIDAANAVVGAETVATLDASGFFEIPLTVTDDPETFPFTFTYMVTESWEGGRQFFIEVPLADAGVGVDISPLFEPPSGDDDPVTPPASSPALDVVGMSNSVLLRTEAIEASTELTYQMSLDYSVESPEFATWADLNVEPTRSQVFVVQTTPTGAALSAGATYAFRCVASNAAGAAPPSAGVIGGLNLSAVALVASSTVTSQLSAGVALVGEMQVGGENFTLSPDEGLTIVLPDGSITNLPTDGSDAIISANLVAKSLIAQDGAQINGASRLNGDLVLQDDSVHDPVDAPFVMASYNNLTTGLTKPVGLSRTIEDDGWVTTTQNPDGTATIHRVSDFGNVSNVGTILNCARVSDIKSDGTAYHVIRIDAQGEFYAWDQYDSAFALTTSDPTFRHVAPPGYPEWGTESGIDYFTISQVILSTGTLGVRVAGFSGYGNKDSTVAELIGDGGYLWRLLDDRVPGGTGALQMFMHSFGYGEIETTEVRGWTLTEAGTLAGTVGSASFPTPNSGVTGIWMTALDSDCWVIDRFGRITQIDRSGAGDGSWERQVSVTYTWADELGDHATGPSPARLVSLVRGAKLRIIAAPAPQVASAVSHAANTVVIYVDDIEQARLPVGVRGVVLDGVATANSIANPSFETNDAGWASTPGLDTVIANPPGDLNAGVSGTKFYRLTFNTDSASGQHVATDAGANPVSPGEVWTGSSFIRATPGLEFSITLRWRDAANATISTDTGASVAPGWVNDDGAWPRISHTATAPAGAASVDVMVRHDGSGASALTGNVFDIDGVMLTKGSTLTPYSEGGSPGANNFAGITPPGSIESTATDASGPLVSIKGDGTWRLGNLSSNDPAPYVPPMIQADSRLTGSYNDPTNWQIVGNVTFATPFPSTPAVTINCETNWGGNPGFVFIQPTNVDRFGFQINMKSDKNRTPQAVQWHAIELTQ